MQRSDLIVIRIWETEHSSLPQVLHGNTEKENDGESEKNIEEQYIEEFFLSILSIFLR